MEKREAEKRIEKLKRVISHHRYLKHVLDKEEISESALDSLKKELFDLEEEYPEFITPDSPTQRVAGKPLKEFAKVNHQKPMFSLNDSFSEQDILDWQERFSKLISEKTDYFCEAKVDGLAVSLVYKQGVLQKAATRGDGKVGEDVTQNIKTIEAVPLKLEADKTCEIRGEAFIAKKDFLLLNKEQEKKGEELFANPRNTAAGALRQLDPKVTAKRRLSFLAWQLVEEKDQATEEKELKKLGFKTPLCRHCPSLKEVFAFYEEVLKQREKLPYQIDGIVVSVNNNALFDKLGVVGKSPRGSIAYKFPLKQATTIIKDIILQVGRTGAITPVAVLEPVNIEGATVSRATLHNEDEIKRLDARVGDTAIVGRAGDVIPQVIKVLKDLRGKTKPFKMPKDCPACGFKLVKPEKQAVWRCPNAKCQAKNLKQIYHFVSKGAFDIEGLGPKIIDQLAENSLIADAADLFFLEKGDLLLQERFAEKSASNLLEEIKARKTVSFPRFIYALGILNVGTETALDLAKHFSSLAKLKTAKKEELEKIEDIGPVVAQSIEEWFNKKQNLVFLAKLEKAGIKITNNNVKSNKLAGKTFVLTGELSSITRDEAKERIRALGGDVSESVSKKTSYVVVGVNPGSKLARAKTFGVALLSEKDFLSFFRND